MPKKILLIDGHSILNRAFYGLPDLTNSDGLHTNAIYGFLTILFKTLKEEEPDLLTVAFDVHAPTFRHEMFKEYKGTRKPMAEELRQQVPVMKELLKAMNINMVYREGLEADDVLGTLSCCCEKQGMDVVILSGDRDLLQLATEKTKIRIPKTKQGQTVVEDYYAEDVKAHYGVTPKEFVDVKALMGDSSDNIPGLPGVGEKTATKIIEAYHNIENAKEHAAEIKPPRAAKALEEHWEQAVLSKTLAKICCDAELDFEEKDAGMEDIYTKEAFDLFKKLEFRNLLGRFPDSFLQNKTVCKSVIIQKKADAEQVFKQMEYRSVGLSVMKTKMSQLPLFSDVSGISGIGVCFEPKTAYCICESKEITSEWIEMSVKTLSEKNSRLVVFDLKAFLKQISLPHIYSCFDLSVAAYLLNPLSSEYSYKRLKEVYLGEDSPMDEEEDTQTACKEAHAAFRLYPIIKEDLEKQGMYELYEKIELPLVETLCDMEENGVAVEKNELRAYGEKLGEKIEELEKEICGLAGESFNINSPKQLGEVLFEKMKLPGGKKTKSGYSTAANVLEKIAGEHKIVEKILSYRQYSKLKSTYADGLVHFIGADNRIHGKFHQTVTATGRISSSDPNLQNIPVRMELGRMIRKVFVPEDGYVFVDADYSQIELRILAHLSEDPKLIEAYREQKDIHRITAAQVFHVPFDEVTSLQRRAAKAVNFGIVYGISSFGLSEDLGIGRKEAAKYIEEYFETYPRIKEFLDRQVEMAKKNGYVTTLFGRRRPVPELSSSNFMQRSFGERVAMNAPIQGTAADIMKIAMIGVNDRLKKERLKSRLVLQVHDELLVETYIEETTIVLDIVREEMEGAASLAVPLETDIHTGNNWYEAK